MEPLNRINRLLTAALLALFVSLIAEFLALAGIISMVGAQIVLALAFLVGALFIWIEVFPQQDKRLKLGAIGLLLLLLIGLDRWTLKQKRAHLYTTRTQSYLNNPPGQGVSANFVNVYFRNEAEMDMHLVEHVRIARAIEFPTDLGAQREIENRLFSEMLAKLRSSDTETNEQDLPAHGDMWMSHDIPIPYPVIATMSDALYFMGRVEYTDENGSHHTDFCVFIKNVAQPVFSCKGHNEAP